MSDFFGIWLSVIISIIDNNRGKMYSSNHLSSENFCFQPTSRAAFVDRKQRLKTFSSESLLRVRGLSSSYHLWLSNVDTIWCSSPDWCSEDSRPGKCTSLSVIRKNYYRTFSSAQWRWKFRLLNRGKMWYSSTFDLAHFLDLASFVSVCVLPHLYEKFISIFCWYR